MAGFEQAVRRAMDLDGERVTPGAWAEVMARCDRVLHGADPRIRHAAAVGTLVTPDRDSGLVSRLGLNSSVGAEGAVGAGELRRVALLVTRAAARGVEEGPDRLLLAGWSAASSTPPRPAGWRRGCWSGVTRSRHRRRACRGRRRC